MRDTRDDAIAELVAPLAAEAGVDVDDVSVARAGRREVVRITVDADTGLTLDAVADLSRAFSAVLDAADVMGQHSYTLEVGSRGATAPLVLPRHWRRNVGRLVKVTFIDSELPQLIGRLTASDDAGAELSTDPDAPADADGSIRVDFADVRRAVVQVEFTKPGRTPAGRIGRALAADGDTGVDTGAGIAGTDRVVPAGRPDEDADEDEEE